MYWPESQDTVDVKPTPEAASTTKTQYFQSGNPRTGQAATVVPPHILNTLMEELLNVVRAAGITPDKMDDTQLLQAIKFLIEMYGINLGTGPVGTVLTMVTDAAMGWRMASVPQHKQIITASGQFITKEVGAHRVTNVSGGGGGGGGAAWTNGSTLWYCPGGGAGASGYSVTRTVFLEKGQTVDVIIGAGGTAGAVKANGGDGGDTSFGDLVIANGGGGGGGAIASSAGSYAGEGSTNGVHWGTSGNIYVGNTTTGGITNSGGICASAFSVDNQVYGRGGRGGSSWASSTGTDPRPGEAGTSGVCIVEW